MALSCLLTGIMETVAEEAVSQDSEVIGIEDSMPRLSSDSLDSSARSEFTSGTDDGSALVLGDGSGSGYSCTIPVATWGTACGKSHFVCTL